MTLSRPDLSPLGGSGSPEQLTRTDLARIAHAHADAARLAAESGYDAVEIHCGHNYLVSAFLRPRINRRDDRYGGSLANRARLVLDVPRLRRTLANLGEPVVVASRPRRLTSLLMRYRRILRSAMSSRQAT